MHHIVFRAAFSSSVLVQLNLITETVPGLFHMIVGFMAFYHAVASLTQAFTGRQLVPLGPPLLQQDVSMAR